MAFKRSAVRSRLSPPNLVPETLRFRNFFIYKTMFSPPKLLFCWNYFTKHKNRTSEHFNMSFTRVYMSCETLSVFSFVFLVFLVRFHLVSFHFILFCLTNLPIFNWPLERDSRGHTPFIYIKNTGKLCVFRLFLYQFVWFTSSSKFYYRLRLLL